MWFEGCKIQHYICNIWKRWSVEMPVTPHTNQKFHDSKFLTPKMDDLVAGNISCCIHPESKIPKKLQFLFHKSKWQPLVRRSLHKRHPDLVNRPGGHSLTSHDTRSQTSRCRAIMIQLLWRGPRHGPKVFDKDTGQVILKKEKRLYSSWMKFGEQSVDMGNVTFTKRIYAPVDMGNVTFTKIHRIHSV